MGWGDEIVAAGQAQRMWDDDPSTRIAIVGLDGRPRWHPIWDGNPILAKPEHVAAGESVRTLVSGPHCRPYIVYPFTQDSGWTFNREFRCRDHVAKIYLTADERAVADAALEQHGPYVLIEPFSKHGNFRWSQDRWTALAAALSDVTLVQHIHDGTDYLVPHAVPIRATFREACALAASSDLYVRSESGMCHAAAAFNVPQVTLFGGCMDPDVMAGYDGQTVLADRGPGSPCGSWLPCEHCTAAMDAITVDAVLAAVRAALPVRRAA